MHFSFAEFVGNHGMLMGLLRGAAAGGALPSLVLAGPDGVGKKTFALMAAQYLNCERATPEGTCGVCAHCRKIEQGLHPDVRLIVPDGNQIKIEQTRELSADLQFRPFEGKKKVYILDPADRLTEQATNSILKTVEECPAYAWIVLLTEHPNALLPTIRSRCPVYRFAPVPAAEIESLLLRRGLESGKAKVLSRTCGGSVGRAITQDWEKLEAERSRALALLESLAPESGFYRVRSFWSGLSTAERARPMLESLLQTFLVLLRDILSLQEDRSACIVHADITTRLEQCGAALSFQRICQLEANARAALREMQRNVNPQILLESLYFEGR